MKEDILVVVLIYLFISLSKGMDCEHRYMDYIFPISIIHCEVPK